MFGIFGSVLCSGGPGLPRPSIIIYLFWQWLFRRRWQFALKIYFAVIIHVCLYSRICYNYASYTVL